MRVLLTGGTGFIGSAVARVLVREGCEVHALVRDSTQTAVLEALGGGVRLVHADLADRPAIRRAVRGARPEVCFHLAWYTEPGRYLETPLNLELVGHSLGLVSELLDAGCKRLIAAGTCFEYDTEAGCLTEASPTRPRTLYAASKLALATVLAELNRSGSLQTSWLRLFYLYGPREHPRRLVPSIVAALLRGMAAPLTHGTQVRDFLHVDDAAEAFWAVCDAGVTGAVNVASGQPVTVRELADQIGGLIGRPDLLRVGALTPSPGDPASVCANISKLRETTRWRQRYDLTSGLRQTIEWWQDSQHLLSAKGGL